MKDRSLVLEIVTPDGVALRESGVETVVFRRREPGFEVGSEIAVLPLHAPMLARIAVAPVRYRRGGETAQLAVDGGFAEVVDDRVVIVTPRVERIAAAVPDPLGAAVDVCRRWRAEVVDLRYPVVPPVGLLGPE